MKHLDGVHITSEKFENGALFLRFGLPSTLIRHENGAFRKRSSNRRNLLTENMLTTELFENDGAASIIYFLCPSFPK